MRADTDRSLKMAETRRTLLSTAKTLFTDRGYASVATPEIVAAAGLTRGALYHHFPGGRLQLFETIHANLQEEARARVLQACSSQSVGKDRTRVEIDAYLTVASEPAYGRIVMIDGPAVLGWAEWRMSELRVWEPIMAATRTDLARTTAVANVDLKTLELIVFGALGEAALSIASSDEPDKQRTKALGALKLLLDLG
jgi:AcrR family transcriptional regulator